MSVKTRVIQNGSCEITQQFNGNEHGGIDIVGKGYKLDSIVAHSDGTVIQVVDNIRENTPYDTTNPGNMVKIDHGNGYQTRYLHMAYNSIKVSVGEKVDKGQVIGYMGNTGNSFGAHLHFEVIKDGIRINPIDYLNEDFPKEESTVNVYYRVRTEKNGWLTEVKNLDDYAGYENYPITGIAIKVDKGSIRYRVHIKGGKWLPYVTGYDINNFANGYAGNGKIIDAIEVYYYTPSDIRPYMRAKYKINDYPWQYDDERRNGQDGYAGALGVTATKFQIIIE